MVEPREVGVTLFVRFAVRLESYGLPAERARRAALQRPGHIKL